MGNFDVDEFVTNFENNPKKESIDKLKHNELLELCQLFDLSYTKKNPRKADLKEAVVNYYVTEELLTDGDLVEFEVLSQSDQMTLAREKLQADSELARVQYEHEKEIELAKVQYDKEIESAKIQLESEKANLHHKLSMEKGISSTSNFNSFQVVKFVPAFQDDDIEKWFQVFEKAALSVKWPESSWVLHLQNSMKAKAQEAFAALPASEIWDYQKVKKTILLKYSLVPEAYRQQYRELKKKDNETYAEFAYESELLFDRWCTSVEVGTDFDKMRQLILVEQFRNSVLSDISMYLNEKVVSNLRDAGVKADEFALIHKRTNIHKKVWVKGSPSAGRF